MPNCKSKKCEAKVLCTTLAKSIQLLRASASLTMEITPALPRVNTEKDSEREKILTMLIKTLKGKKKRCDLNPSKYYDIIFQESKMIPESSACLFPTSSIGPWRIVNTFSANQMIDYPIIKSK